MNWCQEHPLSEFGVIYDNERYFADYLGVKTFKFVNSGTSALDLIMKRISIDRPKPLIYGPSFCHVSWINVCEWNDFEYYFVDVKEDTLSIDPVKLKEMIVEKGVPDIVVMVDMGGYVGDDTLTVREICDSHGIILVEDAANAFGQQYKGYKAGTIGDFSFFSFSNPKLLTCGEGGAIVCNGDDFNDSFEEMIYQGGWYKYGKSRRTNGLNYIMSNWMTQLLRYQLDDIETIQKERHDQFLVYSDKFNLFRYDSDNKYYSPSYYCYRQKGVSKRIFERMTKLEMYRYKNHDPECKVGQLLEDELVYLYMEYK